MPGRAAPQFPFYVIEQSDFTRDITTAYFPAENTDYNYKYKQQDAGPFIQQLFQDLLTPNLKQIAANKVIQKIRENLAEEDMTGDRQWRCDRCHNFVNAKKKLK